MAGEMAMMLQPFALQDVLALVRFERWDDVLDGSRAAAPAATCRPRSITSRAARRYAGKRQVAEAEKELEALAGGGRASRRTR